MSEHVANIHNQALLCFGLLGLYFNVTTPNDAPPLENSTSTTQIFIIIPV